jgi:hypothetical protein
MQLNLAVNGQPLASLPLDPTRWKDPLYIRAACRLMAMKHRTVIEALQKKPTYYIEVASKMKKARRLSALAFPQQGQLN